MAFDKLNIEVIDEHFDQSSPRHSGTASVLVLAFHAVVRQFMATLLREDVGAGALEVKHGSIECVVVWVTGNGAGASPDCLAGELKCSTLADLGEGARLVVTTQAC